MNRTAHRSRLLASLAAAGSLATLAVGVIGVAPAQAAQDTQTLTCNGRDVTVRVNDNHSSDQGGWGSAQVVSGGEGHLIPLSFEFSVFDDTTQQLVFSAPVLKGAGHAGPHQDTTTCTQTMTMTAEQLADGEPIPPGVDPTDQVTATFTVVAVWKG